MNPEPKLSREEQLRECANACAGRARRAGHAGVRAVQAPRQAGQRARCARRACGRCALFCCRAQGISQVPLSKVALLVACANKRRELSCAFAVQMLQSP